MRGRYLVLGPYIIRTLMPPDRAILHVDMDAFFAAVEMLDDPSLRGRPVLVGHDSPRGVVSAASYEARVFGCHSAQPMAVAKRLCPHAAVVPVRFDRYREISRIVFEVFESVTPVVEPLSIDEAFLDVTASVPLFGPPVEIGRRIKVLVRQNAGITASVGVAYNKFLAKLASDLEKPDGLTVINRENLDAVICPLPIGRIWGIGPKTAERLQGLGVKTVADLRKLDLDTLVRKTGIDGHRYHRLAHGLDDRPVHPDRDAKSVGHEQTFSTDLTDPDGVRAVLLEQAEQVSARLRKHGLSAKSVTVKIRYPDFRTITRQCTLDRPTDTTRALFDAARSLFDAWATAFAPVRLIGLSAGQLSRPEPQLDLFLDPAVTRARKIDALTDAITAKFGDSAVQRGGTLRSKSRRGNGTGMKGMNTDEGRE